MSLADITAGFDGTQWDIVIAEEHFRMLTGPAGHTVPLHASSCAPPENS